MDRERGSIVALAEHRGLPPHRGVHHDRVVTWANGEWQGFLTKAKSGGLSRAKLNDRSASDAPVPVITCSR